MTFDPTKPVRTRDGRTARILATDIRTPGGATIVAVVTNAAGNDMVFTYNSDGKFYEYDPNCAHDLVNIPERIERWANVYQQEPFMPKFKSRIEAKMTRAPSCIGVVKFVFEDDKLVEVTLEKE